MHVRVHFLAFLNVNIFMLVPLDILEMFIHPKYSIERIFIIIDFGEYYADICGSIMRVDFYRRCIGIRRSRRNSNIENSHKLCLYEKYAIDGKLRVRLLKHRKCSSMVGETV